jgi:hypothetical protein
MTLTLYTNPMSRGRIVRWMLEETGAPYEAVVLGYGPPMQAAEYRALNPGKGPGAPPRRPHRHRMRRDLRLSRRRLSGGRPRAASG